MSIASKGTDSTRALSGAWTALVTPFSASDEIDVKALRRIVDAQIAQGIDGLVACGTTGETSTLTPEEQELVVKTVLEGSIGRVPVIVGTGTNATKTTIEGTKRAEKWGAHFALVVCPYYNKPTQEGLFRHFKAVHDEVGLPIIAYNVPGRTASDLLPETIARLVEAEAIVGVKDATADMQRATETLSLVGSKRPFSLLSGDDLTILPFVALGGVGVISVVSNLAPRDTARLVRATEAGRFEEARSLHGRIVDLAKALFTVANPIPVKAGMGLAGWCSSAVRLPLDTAASPTVEVVRQAMHRYRDSAPSGSLEGFLA